MSYFVKWIPENGTAVFQTGVAYTRQTDAMDFACVLLKRTPHDIWIEDGRGARTSLQPAILQHCRLRGRAQ